MRNSQLENLEEALKRTPEGYVQKACTDLLTAERIWWMRLNVGAVKLGNRFIRFAQSGTADVLATPEITMPIAGLRKQVIMLWLELKSATGRQSDVQKEFQREVSEAGHFYLLVRDVDTLRDFLKEKGVTR